MNKNYIEINYANESEYTHQNNLDNNQKFVDLLKYAKNNLKLCCILKIILYAFIIIVLIISYYKLLF